MILLNTAAPDPSQSWIAIGGMLAGAAAVFTLVWTVFKERKARREQQEIQTQEDVDRYLKRSLDAFDDLVSNLQNEVARLAKERTEIADRAARNEKNLTDEIVALRREVAALRAALLANGIAIPNMNKTPGIASSSSGGEIRRLIQGES